MKIVVLDRSSVGEDVSVAPFEKYGEVVLYSNTVAAAFCHVTFSGIIV